MFANHPFLYISLLFVFLSLSPFHNAFLEATPSSVFWTNCTTDIYATGTACLNEDNYFTVFNRRRHNSAFPPDTGLEIGAFSWQDLSLETGIDYLGGTDDPLYFNIGIGMPEDKLFCHAPSLKVGVFNIGTRSHGPNRTDYNIVDLIIGKTLPDWIGGRLFVGGFSGSRAMGKNQQGVMVAFQKFFSPAKSCEGKEYFKWCLCGDYASGKNVIGGGGLAIGYYFTPDIYILSGPAWFNSAKINGPWKWSVQININFSVFDPKKKT